MEITLLSRLLPGLLLYLIKRVKHRSPVLPMTLPVISECLSPVTVYRSSTVPESIVTTFICSCLSPLKKVTLNSLVPSSCEPSLLTPRPNLTKIPRIFPHELFLTVPYVNSTLELLCDLIQLEVFRLSVSIG